LPASDWGDFYVLRHLFEDPEKTGLVFRSAAVSSMVHTPDPFRLEVVLLVKLEFSVATF
jgi:hypothetical protein